MLLLLVLAFVAMRLVPGDPAAMLAGDMATRAQIERVRVELGLDKPVPLQLWEYLIRALQGDLGNSLRTGRDVKVEIGSRIGRTLVLALVSVGFAVVLGAILGVIAGSREGSFADAGISVAAMWAASIPIYWSGILAVYVFAVKLEWLPTGGYSTAASLVLPAGTLGLYQAGPLVLLVRANMLDFMHMDHVRTARAKGLSESRVMIWHVFRLTLVPVVAMIAVTFGRAVGGAAVTETVFNWSGIGRLFVDAVASRDYPLVQALLLFFGVVFVITNMLGGKFYAWGATRVSGNCDR